MRRCNSCGYDKPFTIDYFPRDKARINGLRTQCRLCFNKKQAVYRIQWRKKYPEQAMKYERNRKIKKAKKLRELYGNLCECCGETIEFMKGRQYTEHHISYDPEIKVLICADCHAWLHGFARNHVWKSYIPSNESPYKFAQAVMEMYEKKNPPFIGDL